MNFITSGYAKTASAVVLLISINLNENSSRPKPWNIVRIVIVGFIFLLRNEKIIKHFAAIFPTSGTPPFRLWSVCGMKMFFKFTFKVKNICLNAQGNREQPQLKFIVAIT